MRWRRRTTNPPRRLADRRLVEDGYARVNAMWKTQGAVATLRYVHHLPHGRAIPLGLELSEIDRIIASCDSFYRGGYRDWPTQWFKAGDQYLERGRKALASGYRETAAQMIFTAAACYHIAGYMHHDIGRLLPETQAFDAARGRALLGGGAAVLAAVGCCSKFLTTARRCGRSCACRRAWSVRPASS